jgi:hypothetical protein
LIVYRDWAWYQEKTLPMKSFFKLSSMSNLDLSILDVKLGPVGASMYVTKALLDGKPLKPRYLVGKTLTSETGCPIDFEAQIGFPPSLYEAYPTAAVGYWVVIPPLSKGKHKIKLAGGIPDVLVQDFTLHIIAV